VAELELPGFPVPLDDAVSQLGTVVPLAAKHIAADTSMQAPLTWQDTLPCGTAELLDSTGGGGKPPTSEEQEVNE